MQDRAAFLVIVLGSTSPQSYACGFPHPREETLKANLHDSMLSAAVMRDGQRVNENMHAMSVYLQC